MSKSSANKSVMALEGMGMSRITVDAMLVDTSGTWTTKVRPAHQKDKKRFKKQFKPNRLLAQGTKYTHNQNDYLL